MAYYVYIVSSEDNKQIYTGITVDMKRRMKLICAQSEKTCKVVYYEEFDNSEEATRRFKELESLPKTLITELVNENNPLWVDVLK